jgi:hypothetical protein
MSLGEDKETVCTVCGMLWVPPHKNLCECGGFCTWGKEKGADPDSWEYVSGRWIPRKPNVKEQT